MFISADQLLAHAIGDYVLQSDWMANEKTKSVFAASLHAIVYSLPFLAITSSASAMAFIVLTHALIDHFRLARFVVWAKNLLGPRPYRHPWSECSGTGYHKDRPPWMAVWLLIIADNVMHVVLNGIATKYL